MNTIKRISIVVFGVFLLFACMAPRTTNKDTAGTEPVLIKDMHFKNVIDFTAIPPSGIDGVKGDFRNRDIRFVNCTFDKAVLGYINSEGREMVSQFYGDISFENCFFNDEVDFRKAAFHGKVYFSKCKFMEKTNFQDATFMQYASYYGSEFSKELFFQNARFYNRASFMEITAAYHLMFQSAQFRDDVNFSVSKAFDYVDFSLCRFYGKASFNYLEWTDRITFNKSVFFLNAEFLDCSFGDLKMENVDKRASFKMSLKEDE